jgi:hypothetical protein
MNDEDLTINGPIPIENMRLCVTLTDEAIEAVAKRVVELLDEWLQR